MHACTEEIHFGSHVPPPHMQGKVPRLHVQHAAGCEPDAQHGVCSPRSVASGALEVGKEAGGLVGSVGVFLDLFRFEVAGVARAFHLDHRCMIIRAHG
jgi:hypothetical protein